MAKIDAKYLKGLKWKSAERKQVEKEGQKVYVYTPTERPLRDEDVMAVKDYGAQIVFTTTDGQKYTIEKKE